ncbi:dnaJ homolog subfamily B member 12 [Aplysia californica]|uniref:DnaJ homolog subfamily B member 12 n=1 Tax=Aplysia californica TaxID=6500 RepID=A0ABM0K200_APLCA|nr:dnaJ homolog subfamily B member 12 [Aplysia californica]
MKFALATTVVGSCTAVIKMDGNKDESEKCISIALRALSAGDKEKANRFLLKAQRLYPSKKATDLLDSLDKLSSNGEAQREKESESSQPRHRKHSHSKGGDEADKENKHADYTADQLASVKRINECKDVYEVLELSKEFSDSELKKAYRKLALQMHPDKNKAPGATEAFKAIGKAYSILSDKEKRRQYDLYGPEMQPSRPSHDHGDFSHGFDGDISPEELFNMFFGGGFPSGNVHRRQHHHHARRTYYTYREPQQSESGLTLFFQLAPILLLVVLSMLSSFLVSDAVFNLQRTEKYRVERTTANLRVTYYVKDDFRAEFKSDLRRIERAVEEEYIGQLRNNCFRERNYKENMMWRARNYGDAKLYQRAVDMATPSCDNLQKVYTS